jgi:hypothetical protein
MVCKGLDCGVFVIRLPVSDRRLQGLALPPQAAPFRHARQADVHLFGNLRTRIPFLEEPYQFRNASFIERASGANAVNVAGGGGGVDFELRDEAIEQYRYFFYDYLRFGCHFEFLLGVIG